jgi:hypothetical protein
MNQLPTHCRKCRKPLSDMPVGRFYRRVCVNWKCPLHRECQGIWERHTDLGSIATFMPAPLTDSTHKPRKDHRGRKKTVRRKELEYARKTL